MNFNFILNSGKTAILKIGSCCLFFFLLSSCSVLKNAGIEQRKYRPGFFIEGSSRKVTDTKKLAVANNNCEHDLYCMAKEQLPYNGMNEAVQKNQHESLKLNIEKSKRTVLINTQKSKFSTSKNDNFYLIKKQDVSFKDNHTTLVRSAKEDKNYTAFQVILFLVAIFLLYGILTLMIMLFPIMSFAIALVLSVLIWIPVFIVLWLVLASIKAGIDKKHPDVLK